MQRVNRPSSMVACHQPAPRGLVERRAANVAQGLTPYGCQLSDAETLSEAWQCSLDDAETHLASRTATEANQLLADARAAIANR